MSSDQANARTPYLLGRLFALIERIEGAALGEAPRETSERNFADAARSPALAFPALLRATSHFATRSAEGLWLERGVGEIVARLPESELPSAFTREERRSFAVGYAHERSSIGERGAPALRPSVAPSSGAAGRG